MTLFMLVGATCFCMFMILCLESMEILRLRGVKKNLIYFASIFVGLGLGILLDIRSVMLMLSIVYGLSGITLAILFKSAKRAALVVLYGLPTIWSVSAVSILFLTVIGRAYLYTERFGVLVFVLTAALFSLLVHGIRKFLKNRIDMNIFNNGMMHVLIVTCAIALALIYIYSAEDHAFMMFRSPDTALPVNLAEIAYILLFVSLGAMIIVIIRNVSKEATLRAEQLFHKAAETYTRDLEEAYKRLRIVKHDYANMMTTFKLYIDKGDLDGLRRYYDEVYQLGGNALDQDKLMTSLRNIRINEIKGILIYKCAAASESQITVTIETPDLIEHLGASTAIVCQILGILLDNAIEAATDTEEKRLSIAIFADTNAKVFVIQNTWNPQELPVGKLFDYGLSTKGSERGVGLSTVRSYLDQIKGLSLQTEVDAQRFTQILTVKDRQP